MAVYKHTCGGDDFNIETEPLPNGKWRVAIFPANGGGGYVAQPTVGGAQVVPVQFDDEASAIDAAENNIKLDIY